MCLASRNCWGTQLSPLCQCCARGFERGMYHYWSTSVVNRRLQENVLVNDAGEACICDFALSSIARILGGSPGPRSFGSVRWMAPELFDIDHFTPKPTKASDVYSFAMVSIEVVSHVFCVLCNWPWHSRFSQDFCHFISMPTTMWWNLEYWEERGRWNQKTPLELDCLSRFGRLLRCVGTRMRSNGHPYPSHSTPWKEW
jgi:serine/threonine protein kinase